MIKPLEVWAILKVDQYTGMVYTEAVEMTEDEVTDYCEYQQNQCNNEMIYYHTPRKYLIDKLLVKPLRLYDMYKFDIPWKAVPTLVESPEGAKEGTEGAGEEVDFATVSKKVRKNARKKA